MNFSDLSSASPADVIGRTEMPPSSIRNGYSLVPWAEPRYFDDAQAARGDLILDPVVEQDHAVGDVFLEAVTSELALPALGGDDGGDAAVLQPAE